MIRLEIFVLGSMRVLRDGQPVTGFGYAKVQALLAYLAVETGRAHPRDELAELLWPNQPRSIGRANLRQALAHLRRALDTPDDGTSLISTTRATVQLLPDEHCWRDLTAFDDLLLVCSEFGGHDDMLAAQRLQQAGALYRGDFLQGFPVIDCPAFDQWVYSKQITMRTRVLQALQQLAAIRERQGAYDQAIQVARRQLAIETWDESAHRTIMRLLASTGQREAALAQFAQCRLVLRTQMDMEPASETIDLYAQIKAGAASPLQMPVPPVHPSRADRIPVQPDALIGRERELHILHNLLLDPTHRLVTISGPGGIGKTRLALQAAHDLAEHFVHGVYLVRLVEPVNNAALAATIADTLSMRLAGQRDTQSQLLDFLAERQLLLVLDSAEYALDGLDLLVTMFEAAPFVTLLATSRERLRLRWEWRLELGGLALPDSTTNGLPCAAVQLFVHCARRLVPEFCLKDTTYPAVVQICRLLEGVPLGIELAANGLANSDVCSIARQLAANMTMLQTDLRDVPERQRSLWNVCQYSWQRLNAQEQRGMQRLAVFRGGFTLTAACAVTDTTEYVLASLIDKSLLQQDPAGRYHMHEFIRQFADEQLSASDEEVGVRHRHLDYYVRLAEECEGPLCNGPQDRLLASIQELLIETANWRAALSWAEVSSGTRARSCGMRLVTALAWYWHYHGDFSTGWQICERWLTHAEMGGSSVEYAGVCWTVGCLAYSRHDSSAARETLEHARLLLRDAAPSSRQGYVLSVLGLVYLALGDLAMARSRVVEARAIFSAIADDGGLSHVEYVMGGIYQAEGAYEEACACFERGLVYNLQRQHIFAIIASVARLGSIKQQLGDTESIRILFRDSMALVHTYCTSGMGVFQSDSVAALATILDTNGWTEAAAALWDAIRLGQA